MPKRIQRRRTKGWRLPEGAVSVMRPGKWGNPFRVDHIQEIIRDRKSWAAWAKAGTLPWTKMKWTGHYRDTRHEAVCDAVKLFREYLTLSELDHSELRGKDLACWCRLCEAHKDGKPLGVECPDCDPCHADVLLSLSNQAAQTAVSQED